MRKLLKDCKEKVEVSLTRAAECLEVDDRINALCGQSRHTSSSESYFAESSYHTFTGSESIILNSEGKAINVLPVLQSKKTTKAWHCSYLCKTKNVEILNNLQDFFKRLLECSLKKVHKLNNHISSCSNKVHDEKVGHSHGCYINPKLCKSNFLAFEILAPHFPDLRNLKRMIYRIVYIYKHLLHNLDKALNDSDLETLGRITLQARKEAEALQKNNTDVSLNEEEIISRYYLAFKAFTKRSMDTPRIPCVSCEKLCFQREVRKFDISKRTYKGNVMQTLINHIVYKVGDVNFICRYCHDKIRKDSIPPKCILNKLDVRSVPEIAVLNDYERILIQRAKPFQTVVRMDTVMRKNMPHKHMFPKVKGRTFHLPLPLEENLKKICPSTEPLNQNHELYILVRGVPTKSKIVWEKLVDLKKVWNALVWLKANNPLYSEIVLPQSHDLLLSAKLPDTEFQEEVVANDDNNESIEDVEGETLNIDENHKRALLTQMSQSDSYYDQFTIYPMYDKRVNESATALYQMLKVQDIPLGHRAEHLDVKCFPDLYPYGVNGQHEERLVRLTDHEFIKSKLMSKHSQFRLNMQYIFHLLHDTNMRQLNAGIFHKMNVVNPREKYTAASFLEQLSKDQLQTNLNTIFSRLRNTAQYWRKPRNDLNCMIHHYGPATWFLTLSPSEWLWTDLIEYLRDVNGPSVAKMSPNELIASDPVSTSRFIDNTFHAMLDFICSPDNPIGKVTHYFWRREYQSRGLQHFHLLIWIEDAPIIDKSSKEEVAAFIMKYVTCRLPSPHVSPELYRRVIAHQMHKCNSYCLRNKKTKNSFCKVCRFSFPRPVTDTLIIRDVAVSIGARKQLKAKGRLYDLPRSIKEVRINDFNAAVLTVWRGNMDIQYIGERTGLVTCYCTKYVSKPEKKLRYGHYGSNKFY